MESIAAGLNNSQVEKPVRLLSRHVHEVWRRLSVQQLYGLQLCRLMRFRHLHLQFFESSTFLTRRPKGGNRVNEISQVGLKADNCGRGFFQIKNLDRV